MAVIVVTSAVAGAGKSGVAAAIARHYAYAGRPVRLIRLSGDAAAATDAAYFGQLAFAPGSPSAPQAKDAIARTPDDAVLVIEAEAGESTTPPGAQMVFVGRGSGALTPPAGAIVIRTDVPPSITPSDDSIVLREDRILAGFSLAELRAAINADVLVEGDDDGTTCDHLVIAPISSDAGQPYFRRFGTKAVVVRFDKTDMHLAAMKADPQVLILTGGRRPSDYLFDAAGSNGIPVLLSRTDTENTVIALEGIFDHTRFTGDRKLDRMTELLEGSALFERLAV